MSIFGSNPVLRIYVCPYRLVFPSRPPPGRARKVKCDEAKSDCLRCADAGRKCDGYLDAAALAMRRRRCRPPVSSATAYAEAVSSGPRLGHSADAAAAAASFPAALPPQPGGLVVGGGAPEYALKHSVAPLMTCVLFVCIEVMQGKDKEALLHLEKGRHILGQLARGGALDDAADPEMAVVRQHLVPLYTRLNMTSFLFGGNPVVLPTSLLQAGDPVPDTPPSIYSLRCTPFDFVDAVLRLNQQARRFRYAPSASCKGWRSLEAEQKRLDGQLARLRVAQTLFRVSQSTGGGASASLSTVMALFEIHLCIANIWLATALARSEMVFDAHLATFSSIVSPAAAILDAEHQRQPKSGGYQYHSHSSGRGRRRAQTAPSPPAVFMLETRVIPALYYVVTKCRHPLVRRAALGLL